jgi:hypothetical protein
MHSLHSTEGCCRGIVGKNTRARRPDEVITRFVPTADSRRVYTNWIQSKVEEIVCDGPNCGRCRNVNKRLCDAIPIGSGRHRRAGCHFCRQAVGLLSLLDDSTYMDPHFSENALQGTDDTRYGGVTCEASSSTNKDACLKMFGS